MRKNKTHLSKLIIICTFITILVSLTLAQEQAAGTIEVTSLRCAGRNAPVGIDQAEDNYEGWRIELIDGLWYYDEDFLKHPEHMKEVEELLKKRKTTGAAH